MITAIGITLVVMAATCFFVAGACWEEYKATKNKKEKHGEIGGMVIGTILLFAGVWLVAS